MNTPVDAKQGSRRLLCKYAPNKPLLSPPFSGYSPPFECDSVMTFRRWSTEADLSCSTKRQNGSKKVQKTGGLKRQCDFQSPRYLCKTPPRGPQCSTAPCCHFVCARAPAQQRGGKKKESKPPKNTVLFKNPFLKWSRDRRSIHLERENSSKSLLNCIVVSGTRHADVRDFSLLPSTVGGSPCVESRSCQR